MATNVTLEKYDGYSITDTMIRDAATLFSNHYGIWGPPAAPKTGQRVRMSPQMLKSKCMAADASQNIYVRVTIHESELLGNVFATRWKCEGRNVCWITQLCVRKDFRHQGLATRLLSELRDKQSDEGCVYGILSSHPFAIATALRAFGGGIEEFDFESTKTLAQVITASSPVSYVRDALLTGSIFEDKRDEKTMDGVVSCADTKFYVDHDEPEQALEATCQKGVEWPFGRLPDGHEFLAIVEDARLGV